MISLEAILSEFPMPSAHYQAKSSGYCLLGAFALYLEKHFPTLVQTVPIRPYPVETIASQLLQLVNPVLSKLTADKFAVQIMKANDVLDMARAKSLLGAALAVN